MYVSADISLIGSMAIKVRCGGSASIWRGSLPSVPQWVITGGAWRVVDDVTLMLLMRRSLANMGSWVNQESAVGAVRVPHL